MTYMLHDTILIKNERPSDILKRNINQSIPNGDESITLSNKRSCAKEKIELYPKDSIQSLQVHNEMEYSYSNNDFEHPTNTESVTDIRKQETKPIPIIFHFPPETFIDVEKYEPDNMISALDSIYSTDTLR